METLINISIGGKAFSLTTSAHTKLSEYLASISAHFKNTEVGDDIVSDIEARVADILGEHNDTTNSRPVDITIIENIISRIGTAKEISGDDSAKEEPANKVPGEQKKEPSEPHTTQKRKLYRDRSNAIIGGVCSGLARYFDIDATIIRLLTILLTFITGPVIIFGYLIMWAIVPEAKSTADRLQMDGETPTLENIAARIREEAAYFSTNKEAIEQRTRVEFERAKHLARDYAINPASRFASGAGRLIRASFASLLILIGAGTIVGISGGAGAFIAFELPNLNIPITPFFVLAVAAGALVIAIPAALFLYTGIAMLMAHGAVKSRVIIASLLVWALAIGTMAFAIPIAVNQFEDSKKAFSHMLIETDFDSTQLSENYSSSTQNNTP